MALALSCMKDIGQMVTINYKDCIDHRNTAQRVRALAPRCFNALRSLSLPAATKASGRASQGMSAGAMSAVAGSRIKCSG